MTGLSTATKGTFFEIQLHPASPYLHHWKGKKATLSYDNTKLALLFLTKLSDFIVHLCEVHIVPQKTFDSDNKAM